MADYKDYYAPYSPPVDHKQEQINKHATRIKDLENTVEMLISKSGNQDFSEFVQRLNDLEENITLMLKAQAFADGLTIDQETDLKTLLVKEKQKNYTLEEENRRLKQQVESLLAAHKTVSEALEALNDAGEWDKLNFQ